MHNPSPLPLSSLSNTDAELLRTVAKHVLGSSDVAATTAATLRQNGFDEKRVDILIPQASVAVRLGDFVFKKVEADKETPTNFGLFVRRRPKSGTSINPFA
jgi:hypothetical protein